MNKGVFQSMYDYNLDNNDEKKDDKTKSILFVPNNEPVLIPKGNDMNYSAQYNFKVSKENKRE